ncbi:L,D-transpeptidase family protein [Pseudomonas fontis]|uniref:L,D-transpeptidase family protein n=1 Tax=Pseudomonas fontis TaxID=2942633 RepID=A0ABT5P041_9PSED|nr:L,D-transpeptidase family protein [Pseudomonas fontis]MDD0972880.1 L,D-transpeptidase family protein [Pseudomonas fontis]MDD0993825.1 L,D-transpeptidase family protein [Pseudomonas fontis]
MRWLLALFCVCMASVSQAAFTETIVTKPITKTSPSPLVPAVNPTMIDKILVLKSERRLQLISGGSPLKTYRISLGKQPKGAKEREGDKRTPEGLYWIDWRKVSDRYNLAMHVSYPNITDAAKARREGVSPGGMIMIHGTPLDDDYPEEVFHTLDWTEGCIAMTNRDMREVWNLVPDGTLIEIRP